MALTPIRVLVLTAWKIFGRIAIDATLLASMLTYSAVCSQAQTFAYVTNANDGTISVIDTRTNTVVKTITVGDTPFAIAITPDGNLAYVPNNNFDNVLVVDLVSGTVIAAVPVGINPAYGVAITPDGTRVYVTNQNSNSVSVISTATNTVIATIPLAPAGVPRGIAITPDGTRAYAVINLSCVVSVIDTASNTVSTTITLAGCPGGIQDVAFTPDGSRAYVTDFGGSGSVWVINATTNTVVTNIPVTTNPFRVAITPDGGRAYVSVYSSDNVSVINTATNTATTTVGVGGLPFGVAITPDGSRVYVTNTTSKSVSVIDTATNTVVATVPVGNNPFGVAISPALHTSQLHYFSNLNATDSVINITNTGASATALLTPGQTNGPAQNNIDGSVCVNIYAFAADEQEVACCSCLVTPNALWSASVKTALLNSVLTPSFPNEVVVKLIPTIPSAGPGGVQTCNPATGSLGTLATGLLAWGTTVHGFPAATGPAFSIAETPFSQATVTPAELARDVQECQFIQILGSGQFGICKGCSNVGLGAAAQ